MQIFSSFGHTNLRKKSTIYYFLFFFFKQFTHKMPLFIYLFIYLHSVFLFYYYFSQLLISLSYFKPRFTFPLLFIEKKKFIILFIIKFISFLHFFFIFFLSIFFVSRKMRQVEEKNFTFTRERK